ncbi:dihydroxyacetone kinase subunit DhaL [Leadbettera azotonutricia]|uniref:Dihydroxyacetone kinase, L subunit n=1 Tax=Leadbettera azotonutricia (strain ATCC BAA-888 / DSM 13862 / ZAS-9) TaxID=545695 RepID=F5YET5_LEAAZ|nr:dihydroxyacetone kinase subunit DhaL [Leadbettera azotonutricia]AEF81550.1 dihydroxyacetone kinase, L subunit [Leadbettera azotonutricia ZAS-9]
MRGIKNSDGKPILLKMVAAIQKNKDYLGEVDGLIGDGDHGMNMNKGFSMFAAQIADKDIGFADGLDELGTLLFSKIGGSMGPIYGAVFTGMAEAGEDLEDIDAVGFAAMIDAGLNGLRDIVEAQVGDKTLIDTLAPANEALQQAVKEGKDLAEALNAMKAAAEKGRDSTRDLAAKFGRSSRLGERSRGVLDAGAVSCCIILGSMADGILEQAGA